MTDSDHPAGSRDGIACGTENVRLRQWQTSALRDFEIANEILNEQAVRREWCSEYEDVLERINGRTSVLSVGAEDS